ncbi:succinyldiaminopimelate aminotransferase [Flavobacteriaceae bacterium (ex Bugula neritina AB1)]|nr:succinyldiaminopimelate aminotransferase [Flavobacteriaceae bacterium (ex Bugula neritina AB1)]
MDSQLFFEELWKQYTLKTPSALEIKSLFEKEGNTVFNDHIAIRTFDDPRIDIEVLARPFIKMGYREMGEYHFKAKKLYAKHYELENEPNAPKIFISQLLTHQFSNKLQQIIKEILDIIDQDLFKQENLILQGRIWDMIPSFKIYKELQKESEYASWMYVNGFCSNHFTVNVNKLQNFESLSSVNDFLKSKGFKMNSSGGEIKGSPLQLLEQSSILADVIDVAFEEGIEKITSCYYEFAYRYPKKNGEIFNGFIANSADKIFESTDMKLQAS